MSDDNPLTQAELDFAVEQTVRMRAELTDQFGERGTHVFVLATIFALGDLFAEQDEKDLLAEFVNQALSARTPEFRVVRVN
jgi:hypothetical protein